MKRVLFLFLFLVIGIPAFAQTSTTVSVSYDPYDWDKLVVNHFIGRNGVNFQAWYKHSNDTKRFRLSYQRKFVNYTKENHNFQLTGGLGLQITTRKRAESSKQVLVSTDVQYRYKINKNVSLTTRAANFLSISPTAKEGDHTDKFILTTGVKYKKIGVHYYSDYLYGFKAKLRNNFQGAGGTYDLTPKVTLGANVYWDLKQTKRDTHYTISMLFKF